MIEVILKNRWAKLNTGQVVLQKYVAEIGAYLDKNGDVPISLKNGRWENVDPQAIDSNNPVSFDLINFARKEDE